MTRTPSLRRGLYGLFLTTALWACGRMDGPRDARVDRLSAPETNTRMEKGLVLEIAPNDMASQKKALKQKYPKMNNAVSDRLNDFVLQTSAMDHNSINQFTVAHVMEIADVLIRDEDVDAMAMDVLGLFEGVRLDMYEGPGGRLISRGILLPPPETAQDELMEMVSDAANGADYKDVYNGDVSLDPELERDLAVLWLNRTGQHKDKFLEGVERALAFDDITDPDVLDKIKEDDIMGDLHLDHIPPMYQALIISDVWQSFGFLDRDPAVTAPLIRVLADDGREDEEKLDAFLSLNLFYMDNILLRNPREKKAPERKVYAVRALVIAAAATAAFTQPETDEDLRLAAEVPVPKNYIASQVKAMLRDQGPHALIIQMGYLPCPIGEVLLDPNCGWKKDGREHVVMPGASAAYHRVEKNGTPHWQREIYHRVEPHAKKDAAAAVDTVTVAIDDLFPPESVPVRGKAPKPN